MKLRLKLKYKLNDLIFDLKGLFRICQHGSCWERGVKCRVVDYHDDGSTEYFYYYCVEHCQENGFCYLCGEFFGGIESFDFGSGLCADCYDEVEADDTSYACGDECEFCRDPCGDIGEPGDPSYQDDYDPDACPNCGEELSYIDAGMGFCICGYMDE